MTDEKKLAEVRRLVTEALRMGVLIDPQDVLIAIEEADPED